MFSGLDCIGPMRSYPGYLIASHSFGVSMMEDEELDMGAQLEEKSFDIQSSAIANDLTLTQLPAYSIRPLYWLTACRSGRRRKIIDTVNSVVLQRPTGEC